ncbi:class I SAM-dependent methyltransferase [Clostridium cochlearium]|uniref:tRNA (adenine(22)-N(1))-methyltransferase n=1 Tax=Clostridium cochlearium TaxID=1494 RepID=UPI00181A8DA8|nr:class I SAM-dependent methyltransferase [Clostridium cochlearium]MCR1971564.1 class I SAM-dependent methyltransferase [Clostridium cochlearium]NMA57571.1 SAM-dependent methyltransferase [Clostridium cochlearium]
MDISLRLKSIASMVDRCDVCVDIGTDHGYIPIYLIDNHICNRVIATDINKEPLNRAKENVTKRRYSDKVDFRLGSGLNTIDKNEADVAIIAGMGGNLIKEIIGENIEKFKSFKYLIVQPVQNVDVLRKYIYSKGFDIIEEKICIEDDKFYEIIKIKYNSVIIEEEDIFYEVSKYLYERKDEKLKKFIEYKIKTYEKVYSKIECNTAKSTERKKQLEKKIIKLKELIK